MMNVADFKYPNDPQGRTYREINNAIIHSFEVGDLVEIDDTGVRLFVAKQTRDCDGTPLYCLTAEKDDYEVEREGFTNSNWMNGMWEFSLTKII